MRFGAEGRAGGFRSRADGYTPARPEFPGNRRFDGVQNLVQRPGIGLLFVVPGISETLRVNGFARLTREPDCSRPAPSTGAAPWFVADVEVRQVFSHCGKAFLRSRPVAARELARARRDQQPEPSIAGQAEEQRRRESDVRREVEDSTTRACTEKPSPKGSDDDPLHAQAS